VTVIEGIIIISRFVAGGDSNPGNPADTPASKKGLYYDHQRTNMFICPYSDSERVTVVIMLSFPRNGTLQFHNAISC
jgi:hypothetical protein